MSDITNLNELKIKLREWQTVDDNIRELNEQLKEARKIRTDLEKKITHYTMVQQNIPNAEVECDNSTIRIHTVRNFESLTFGYLERALSTIVRDPEQAKIILDHIRKNREVKEMPEIKKL